RHLERAGLLNRLNDQALVRVAGEERRSRVAAFPESVGGVQLQAGHLLGPAVALIAVSGKYRSDFGFEERDLVSGWLGWWGSALRPPRRHSEPDEARSQHGNGGANSHPSSMMS